MARSIRGRRGPGPALAALLLCAGAAACDSETQTPPAWDAAPAEGGARDGAPGEGGTADGSAADAGPGCAKPTPFSPPGKPAGFKLAETKLLVVTQGPANHRAQDVVAVVGAPQVLIGKFAYGVIDKDLKQEDVEIYVQEVPPCGPWVLVGSAVTSKEGEHGTLYGVADDGGRVYFKLPAAHARPAGRYPVRMLVKGDHSAARLTLHVVPAGAGAVVFDIDGTLTTDDFQLVTQLFSQLLLGSYTPKMYKGAVDVVKAWDAKGYLPIYLTARPDALNAVSRAWLIKQGFPPGALHLTDTLAQALPANTAAYKADHLNKLQAAGVELALEAGYGNATTDIEAYDKAKLPKARTYIIGPNAGAQGTVALTDYPSHLPAAQAMPAAATPAPPSSFGW